MRDLPTIKLDLKKPETFKNVAALMDPADRRTLASDLIELIESDRSSMSDWLGRAQGYLDKLDNEGRDDSTPQNTEQQGANEEPPPTTEMTLTAAIQFSARATDAILGEPDLAKASEPGGEPLASWVSSQLRTKDPNWTLDTDPLIIHMSVTGLAWRKRDFDDDDRVFHSHFCPCTAVIINANVIAAERAPRITEEFERYPYEIERSIEREKWVDYEPRFDEKDPQAPHRFFETDAWLDLDGDGINEPWSVTIARDDTAEVVRIRPRWSAKTIVDNDNQLFFNPIRRFYPYRFLPDPKGGFFPMGFGKLLDRTESSANQLLGAIVDTAKTESENGGVLGGSGLGLPDKVEVQNNRVTTLPTDGRPLSAIYQPFPVKSVSAGSVAALEKVMTLGDRLAGTLNLLENAPASMTATMAKGIIDTGHQIQGAVHRRIVASMTQEIRMFARMADAYGMLPADLSASGQDGIAITADPALATEMQRSALGGLYMEMAMAALKGVPWNVKECQIRFCQVMRLPNPEKLIGEAQKPQATDDEKLKGMIGLGKLKIDQMKIKALVAVQITQAIKNMVEASAGMLDNRTALLQLAQLEHAVQELMTGSDDANNILNGMASQPGNAGPNNAPAPPQDQNNQPVPPGSGSAPGPAGAGI